MKHSKMLGAAITMAAIITASHDMTASRAMAADPASAAAADEISDLQAENDALKGQVEGLARDLQVLRDAVQQNQQAVADVKASSEGSNSIIRSGRKRNAPTTQRFVNDLSARIVNAPQISSDGFEPYVVAVENAFGARARYGQIVKSYSAVGGKQAARRYSPGHIVSVSERPVFGRVDKIPTSLVERQNLTLRMQQRRFTRLTNGFSKKLENHKAAVSLYVGHYNYCRVHESLRITPAMALGVSDHIWEIGELIEAAAGPEQTGHQVGRFRVIDGDLN
ncbi:MAG: transposase [Alphaproteobacteria bacterium]|jgi:hypothetical protein|nr:transposase [Alphaproteobacteria bacterium]MDP6819633.1 transposase [Alphaproteobacteria bacterium]